MKIIKKVDLTDGFDGQMCRIKAIKVLTAEPRYEVWFTKGEKEFEGRGKFPLVEGLMLREDAPGTFYNTLLRACKRIGDRKSLEMNLSPYMVRCVCSLSMWSQDLPTISNITGIELEAARRITFALYREGYLTLAQSNGRTKMALTPKGWRAHDELSEGSLEKELLNKTVDIYEAEFMRGMTAGNPHI
jgi:hypothetical protein